MSPDAKGGRHNNSETLWIVAVIEDFNSGLVVSKQVILLPVLLLGAHWPQNGLHIMLRCRSYL